MKRSMGIIVGVAMAGCALMLLAAPQKKPLPPTRPQPSYPRPGLMFPDIAVTDLAVALESTTLGNPGVEFPTDRLHITATLRNLGPAPVPAGGAITLVLTRDGQAVQNFVASGVLGATDSSWNYNYFDTISHGAKRDYEYRLTATPAFSDRDVENNSQRRGIMEPTLHGTYPCPDLAVTGIRVIQETGPAGKVFVFYVRVRNLGMTYYGIGTIGYIDLLRDDGGRIFSTIANVLEWPGPQADMEIGVRCPGASLPAGSYGVKAKLWNISCEPNPANNISPDAVLVTN